MGKSDRSGFSKRTISIPPELDEKLELHVAKYGSFSALVATALTHEIQRSSIEDWLAERESARGGKPLPASAVAFAEAAWQKRKK